MKAPLLLLLLALAISPANAQSQNDSGTAQIFGTLLNERIRGLTRESPRDWTSIRRRSEMAVQEAAADLRRHLETGDNAKELQAPMGGPGTITPLVAAAYMGLADIVEVMLDFPEAREQLNRPLSEGHSLWALVSNAPLVAQIACMDVARLGGAPGSLQGYLGFSAARSPYRKTLNLLEQAGAIPRPEEARALWQKICDPSRFNRERGEQESSPGVAERIATAPDVLEAILKEVETQLDPKSVH